MKQYLEMLDNILKTGNVREDRTGTGTISKFGIQTRYDLQDGFPAMTTKQLYWKGVIYELLWFLRGDTNIKYLIDNGINIWNDDAYRFYKEKGGDLSKEEFLMQIKDGKSNVNIANYVMGDLGPVYGKQWRRWIKPGVGEFGKSKMIDQIQNLINNIKSDPYSRRHILSAWNVSEVDEMGLPPCHMIAQFYVSDNKLSCSMFQRSGDAFLGVPFNIASYSLLTHLIAHICGLGVGEFIHNIGDGHIYSSHINQVNKQLIRQPYELPKLWLNQSITNIDDFKYEDIKLMNYKHHPVIKAPLSVGL